MSKSRIFAKYRIFRAKNMKLDKGVVYTTSRRAECFAVDSRFRHDSHYCMKKTAISYQDFSKLDLRVGEVLKAEPVPKSRKLLQLTVDLGQDYGVVEILSGIQQEITVEDIVGKKFIFLANLEPKKMAGKISQGMLIAADDGGKPVLISVELNLANGLLLC